MSLVTNKWGKLKFTLILRPVLTALGGRFALLENHLNNNILVKRSFCIIEVADDID